MSVVERKAVIPNATRSPCFNINVEATKEQFFDSCWTIPLLLLSSALTFRQLSFFLQKFYGRPAILRTSRQASLHAVSNPFTCLSPRLSQAPSLPTRQKAQCNSTTQRSC
jgi:hypothetical protein